MLIIGENINASTASVAEAIARRDKGFIEELVRAQAAAGADFIDVNVGSDNPLDRGATGAMEWLVAVARAASDKPLVIDSDDPRVIQAALGSYEGEKLMINSVTAEKTRLEAIGPLVAERQASLIALAMGEGGVPDNVDQRLAACDSIMNYLTGLGMNPASIYFDPLVLPIAVDPKQGLVTLKTLERIKSLYPEAKTVMGMSNISYGLPRRKLVNRSFLLMAAYAGLDAVILNPLDEKLMSHLKVAGMLTGNDPLCRSYIRAVRKGSIVD